MGISIAQTSSMAGKGRWRWSVWIEGPDEELDAVGAVVYTLHPTFSNPVRRTTERESRFRLDSSGWGEFKLHASVQYRDGRTESMEHWLTLVGEAPDKTMGTIPLRKRQRIFLSSSMADVKTANAIRSLLEQTPLVVTTNYDASPSDYGVPWELTLLDQIQGSSGAVFLVSERPSPWLTYEVGIAKKYGKPHAVVGIGPVPAIPQDLHESMRLGIKSSSPQDARHVAEALARWAGTLPD
ncbi:MAG TPA: pYEATS domain-containing protein [Longimicrobiaceae bacterium]|nr:pYEATS domain-containing protein [Longimicrobiaceae bacterium]